MADEKPQLSEAAQKLAITFDKAVVKAAKDAKKEVAGENKSENYKTLDSLVRGVAKKADGGAEAVSIKKCKDMALKFYGTDSPARADIEKLIKSLSSNLLSVPKEAKAKTAKKAQTVAA